MAKRININTQGFNPATGEWNDSLTGDFIWGNTNIGEALPNVMTPFTWSVIGAAYDQMNILPQYHSAGNIGGRAYQNASAMWAALQAIGKDPLELVSELGGKTELPEGMTIPVISLPRSAVLPILFNSTRIRVRQNAGLRNLSIFLAESPKLCQVMHKRIAAVRGKADLLPLWNELDSQSVLVFWRVVSTAWRYAEVIAPLRSELTTLVGESDMHILLSGVSQGTELLASLGPVASLSKVARGEMARQAYLEQYGHRGPYEAEFSAPRPAEDPAWLDEQLAAFVESGIDVGDLLARQKAEFEAAWNRFDERYPGKAKTMCRRLDQAARAIRKREATRSEMARMVWVLRAWALRAGELTGIGEDIFLLTCDEALGLLKGVDDPPIATLPARKETYARYCALPPYPSVISGQFDPFAWAADLNRRSDYYDSHKADLTASLQASQSNTILGIAGSAGRVEGLVRRLDSPEAGDQLRQGEILVTSQTNIGWTLLFPRAAAVVTDVGAPLSHAAIVARELGIPAVVGCGDATARLRTGDRVRVDGSQGIVEILGS